MYLSVYPNPEWVWPVLTHSYRTKLEKKYAESALIVLDLEIDNLPEVDHLGGMHFRVTDSHIQTKGIHPFGDDTTRKWDKKLHLNGIAALLERKLLEEFRGTKRLVIRDDKPPTSERINWLRRRWLSEAQIESMDIDEYLEAISKVPSRNFSIVKS